MHSKRVFLIVPFILGYCLLFTCDSEQNPVSSGNETYVTAYGAVTQVDDYPLLTLTYTADYQFDAYLQTGDIPFYTSITSGSKNYACTCFSAFGDDSRLFGRNYDWPDHATYFLVFTDPPDGNASVSTVDMTFFDYHRNESPASSDNQRTRRTAPYYPFDGMNEKGVAIGMNAIPEAQTPYNISKVTIGELQLIRLVLDYANSTREAIALIQQYNIQMEDPPIHYLIADTSGHSAIIEFVDGQMKIIDNTDPWQVTTNFIVTGLSSHQNAPCWRYKTAYETLNAHSGVIGENAAMNLLQSVSVATTRWSVVFNMKNGELQIATGRDYENLHHFRIPNDK